MTERRQIVLRQTDVATLLGFLASRLRNEGLVLEGLAGRDFSPGDRESRDYHELAASLDRSAEVLEALRDRLCSSCKLVAVSEQIELDAPAASTQ